uniref:Uncharacterized protein n=1 Tax=Lygus hesperus TaxID=30085 RepID=A0A0A9XEN0_LYGHE
MSTAAHTQARSNLAAFDSSLPTDNCISKSNNTLVNNYNSNTPPMSTNHPQSYQQNQQQNSYQVNPYNTNSNTNVTMYPASTPSTANMNTFGEIPRQFAIRQQQQQQQEVFRGYGGQTSTSYMNSSNNHHNMSNNNIMRFNTDGNYTDNKNNTASVNNEFSVQGASYNAPLNTMAAPYQPSHLQLRPPYIPSPY